MKPDMLQLKTAKYSTLSSHSPSHGRWQAGKRNTITCLKQQSFMLLDSQLVGALSPVNHKGLHQSWKQISIYLHVIHSTSHYATRLFFFLLKPQLKFHPVSERKTRKTVTHVLEPIHIPRAVNTGTCTSRVTNILFCGPTQEPVLITANTGKTRERFWKKMQVNWLEGLEISKEEISGSKRSMHG